MAIERVEFFSFMGEARMTRHETVMRWIKKDPDEVARRFLQLEDRVNELQDKMHSVAIGLRQVANNAKRAMEG